MYSRMARGLLPWGIPPEPGAPRTLVTIAVSGSHGSTDELGTGVHGGISAIPLGVAVGATVGVAVGAVVGVAVGDGVGVPEERANAGIAVGGWVLVGGVPHAASMSVSDVMRMARVMTRVVIQLISMRDWRSVIAATMS